MSAMRWVALALLIFVAGAYGYLALKWRQTSGDVHTIQTIVRTGVCAGEDRVACVADLERRYKLGLATLPGTPGPTGRPGRPASRDQSEPRETRATRASAAPLARTDPPDRPVRRVPPAPPGRPARAVRQEHGGQPALQGGRVLPARRRGHRHRQRSSPPSRPTALSAAAARDPPAHRGHRVHKDPKGHPGAGRQRQRHCRRRPSPHPPSPCPPRRPRRQSRRPWSSPHQPRRRSESQRRPSRPDRQRSNRPSHPSRPKRSEAPMSATSAIAVFSAVVTAGVFWIIWRTGTRIRHAVDTMTTKSLAEATMINDKLEVIRLDVNSNLTAALEHIEILKDELISHGIRLPDQDPRV